MTLNEFSGGYYNLTMDVQPYSDGPVIEGRLFEYIDEKIYAQTDAPVTLRLGLESGPYFTVDGERAVPTDVLAIPRRLLDGMEIDANGEHEVFVLKPAHSYVLNQSIELSERFTG